MGDLTPLPIVHKLTPSPRGDPEVVHDQVAPFPGDLDAGRILRALEAVPGAIDVEDGPSADAIWKDLALLSGSTSNADTRTGE